MRGGKAQDTVRLWRSCLGGNCAGIPFVEAFSGGNQGLVLLNDEILVSAQRAHDTTAFARRVMCLVNEGRVTNICCDNGVAKDIRHIVQQRALLATLRRGDVVYSKNLKQGQDLFVVGEIDDDKGTSFAAGDLDFDRDGDGATSLAAKDLVFVRRVKWTRGGKWRDIPHAHRTTIFKAEQLTLQQNVSNAETCLRLLYKHSEPLNRGFFEPWWTHVPTKKKWPLPPWLRS